MASYGVFYDPDTFNQMIRNEKIVLPNWLQGSTANQQGTTSTTTTTTTGGILSKLFGSLFGLNPPVSTQPVGTPIPVEPAPAPQTSGSGMGGPWSTSPWHTEFSNLPESRQEAVFQKMATGQYTAEDIASLADRYRMRGLGGRPLQGY